MIILLLVVLLIGFFIILSIIYFKKHPLLICILYASFYIIFKFTEYYHFKAILPSAIEVTRSVSIGEDILDFREGCGAAVFKLSESTMKKIEVHGIRFFDGVTQARGHDDNYYKYENWQETPIPRNWTNSDTWIACSSYVSNDLLEQITVAAKQKGAYYTIIYGGKLVVIPSLGIVVFSYHG